MLKIASHISNLIAQILAGIMDISNLIWCFSTDFFDCSYHRPHCDLVMASDVEIPPDAADLREDLIVDIIQLQGELKMLGFDMVTIPDFLRETATYGRAGRTAGRMPCRPPSAPEG